MERGGMEASYYEAVIILNVCKSSLALAYNVKITLLEHSKEVKGCRCDLLLKRLTLQREGHIEVRTAPLQCQVGHLGVRRTE